MMNADLEIENAVKAKVEALLIHDLDTEAKLAASEALLADSRAEVRRLRAQLYGEGTA